MFTFVEGKKMKTKRFPINNQPFLWAPVDLVTLFEDPLMLSSSPPIPGKYSIIELELKTFFTMFSHVGKKKHQYYLVIFRL